MADHNSTSGPATRGQESHLDLDERLDLLFDRMPPAKKAQALEHLANCPTCEALLRRRVTLNERLRASEIPEHAAVAASAHEEVPALEGEDDKISEEGSFRAWLAGSCAGLVTLLRRPAFQYAGGLVVVAAILLLVILPRQEQGDGDPGLRWLPVSNRYSSARSLGEMAGDENLAAGLSAYADRKTEQAIEHLTRAETQGDFETIRKAYLGSALVWHGDYAEAATLLLTLDPLELPEDFNEVRWALFVALTRSGRETSADSLLRILAQEGGAVAERALQQLGTNPAQ